MTLTTTLHTIKALRPCTRLGLKFSSNGNGNHVAPALALTPAPSAKLAINISAFNGNKTNFGKK